MKNIWIGCILFLLLLLPPIRLWLESIMIMHMLVQIPLLMVVGLYVGDYFVKRYSTFFEKWNASGIPGIVLVVIVTMYWMIPRAMDEALSIPLVEMFKYVGLPLLVGLPLRDSWSKLHTIVKGFVLFNYIPMFGMMAWLYIDSPIQVCNNYLETEQKSLGWGFFLVMMLMLFYILQIVFVDHKQEKEKPSL